jgi:hypothetical protein
MNAAAYAERLKMAGVPVIKAQQGDADVDGEITINERVHIQVPTYGPARVGVVAELPDGKFLFYRERRTSDIDGVLADIKAANARAFS